MADDWPTVARVGGESHAAGASRRRLILAAKVGVAVALSSLLSLVDAAYSFSDSGPWAVVTAVIVLQPTLGSTAYKATQRFLGTVFAAAAAALCGYVARMHMPPLAGQCFLAAAVFAVSAGLNHLSTSSGAPAQWSHASATPGHASATPRPSEHLSTGARRPTQIK